MRRLLGRLDSLLTARRRTLAAATCGVFAALGWTGLILIGRASVVPDFQARWTAGHLFVTGRGALLYDGPEQQAVQGVTGPGQPWSWFVSPPHTAVLFAPLGALSWPVAQWVWGVLTVTALLAVWALTTRWWLPTLSRAGRLHLLLLWVTCISTLELLASGQDSAFVALTGVLAARLWQRGWGLSAGLVASAGLIKPQLVFLVPVLAVALHAWRALAGLTAGTALTMALGLVPGLGAWQSWWDTVTSEAYHRSITAGQSHLSVTTSSLTLSLLPHSWHGQLGWLGMASAVMGAVGMAWWWRRRPRPLELVALTLVAATIVSAPHLMRYDLVAMLPVLSVVMYRYGGPALRLLTAMTYLVAAASQLQWVVPPSASWPLSILRAPALAGLAVVWLGVALRLHARQPQAPSLPTWEARR